MLNLETFLTPHKEVPHSVEGHGSPAKSPPQSPPPLPTPSVDALMPAPKPTTPRNRSLEAFVAPAKEAERPSYSPSRSRRLEPLQSAAPLSGRLEPLETFVVEPKNVPSFVEDLLAKQAAAAPGDSMAKPEGSEEGSEASDSNWAVPMQEADASAPVDAEVERVVDPEIQMLSVKVREHLYSFASTYVPAAPAVTATAQPLEEGVESITAKDIARHLPLGLRVCILGGTSFEHPASETLVKALGRAFAERLAGRVVVLTGGMPGVQQTFATTLGGSFPALVHLLPKGSSSGFGVGTDLQAGATLLERMAMFEQLGDVYILVEGGPGAAGEAMAAFNRGAIVLPMMSTGGASSGMFNVPAGVLQRPTCVTEEQWSCLGGKVAPEVVAATVADITERLVEAKQRGLGSDVEDPKTNKDPAVTHLEALIADVPLADEAAATSHPAPLTSAADEPSPSEAVAETPEAHRAAVSASEPGPSASVADVARKAAPLTSAAETGDVLHADDFLADVAAPEPSAPEPIVEAAAGPSAEAVSRGGDRPRGGRSSSPPVPQGQPRPGVPKKSGPPVKSTSPHSPLSKTSPRSPSSPGTLAKAKAKVPTRGRQGATTPSSPGGTTPTSPVSPPLDIRRFDPSPPPKIPYKSRQEPTSPSSKQRAAKKVAKKAMGVPIDDQHPESAETPIEEEEVVEMQQRDVATAQQRLALLELLDNPQLLEKEARNVFIEFDTDRSGHLDFKELLVILERLHIKFGIRMVKDDNHFERLFKEYDRQHDQLLDFEEFYALLLVIIKETTTITTIITTEEDSEEGDDTFAEMTGPGSHRHADRRTSTDSVTSMGPVFPLIRAGNWRNRSQESQEESQLVAAHIKGLLADLLSTDDDVRVRSLVSMQRLDARAVAPHAGAVANALTDESPQVRRASLVTLQRLGPEATAHHATAIETIMMKDPDKQVRATAKATLAKAPPPSTSE
eukprot:TRINITY_DN9680_c1_g1_i1.p1 TRINITY_DN9680_c1_g1~~TRINITY_DN9680_c1_g1_i1.p1  ORF type:complete len:995 (-),score=225.30 TRINITY_DN9680_c1_g1_i1:52-2934(-)